MSRAYRCAPPGTQPPWRFEAYVGTRLRAPALPPIAMPQTLSEITGPAVSSTLVADSDCDLTGRGRAAPAGQRIIVGGRVIDEDGRAVPHSLVEIWQANAAGRYRHPRDEWNAPLDPNFDGAGRTLTDADGNYRFLTIRPGPYPWKNHHNAWRPAHIHFSLFGNAYATRLITQMYFPGDDLLAFDPIYNAIPAVAARERLVARFDLQHSEPAFALAYRFDIVLRGRDATPME